MGNEIYFGLQLYSLKQGFNLPSANIGLNDIKLNNDGIFEIYISQKRPENAKNWVLLANGDHCFLVRQYFRYRNDIRPAELKIERIGSSVISANDALTANLGRLRNTGKMLVITLPEQLRSMTCFVRHHLMHTRSPAKRFIFMETAQKSLICIVRLLRPLVSNT